MRPNGVSMDLALKPLEHGEMVDAAALFLKAFEVDDSSRVAGAEEFWRLIDDIGIADFMGAYLDQKIVGCGALIRYESSGWIAFMAVPRDMRGKGIGTEIMAVLLKRASEAGIKTLKLDATNWGRPLYDKHGFVEEYPARMFEVLPRYDSDLDEEPNIVTSGDLPQWCLDLDREAFGDDRSALLRKTLDSGGQLIVHGHEGYGILWNQKIGPVVALSPRAARSIVSYAYTLGARRVYVPLHENLPGQFLIGLRQIMPTTSIRCCDRMTRGDRLQEDTRMVFASFSAATG
jgi:GNAT superfamily N-acetyltransferase